MTTQLERPAVPETGGRPWFQWLDLGTRAALLLVLVTCWAGVLLAHTSPTTTPRQFVADLKTGRVANLVYVDKTRTLRWTDGWWHWHHVDLAGLLPTVGVPGDQDYSTSGGGNADNSRDLTWLVRAEDGTGPHVSWQEADGSAMSWTAQAPWHGLSQAAATAVALAFLFMLGRDHRWFANRWGWLWLFLIGGGIGPALFLVLEPFPIFKRDHRPVLRKSVLGGGYGFLVACLAKFTVGAVAVWVFGR
jgi:hypothetical protein